MLKLVLPKFKGDITQFRSFWDFESAVHKNPGLSTVGKFNYLNSLLEGTVQGLLITEGNYQSAFGILQQRFGKSQAIISAHMEELMKISACGDKPHKCAMFMIRLVSMSEAWKSLVSIQSDTAVS